MPQIELFSVSEMNSDEVRQVEIPERDAIAVYRLGDEFFATDDTCTHGSASLAEGDIEGDEIICPFHLGGFDIRTGEATVPPCTTALRTYPIVIEEDTLYVEINP